MLRSIQDQRSASEPKKGKRGADGDVQTAKGGSSYFLLHRVLFPYELYEVYGLPDGWCL